MKNDFNTRNEAKYAAREFFKMTYNTAISGTYFVQESKIALLYDYESTFEDSNNRVQKMTRFLESLHLGRIGSKGHEEFLQEQKDFMQEAQGDDYAKLDDEQMENLILTQMTTLLLFPFWAVLDSYLMFYLFY